MRTTKSTVSASGKAYYMISAVAQKYSIHPQTLRLYEREGLLKPSRTDGNTRLYSDEDLQRLETILSLTRDLGVNLAFSVVIIIPIAILLSGTSPSEKNARIAAAFWFLTPREIPNVPTKIVIIKSKMKML